MKNMLADGTFVYCQKTALWTDNGICIIRKNLSTFYQ